VKNSQHQNWNQHSKVTCLLILNVHALVRMLKNDWKMKKSRKTQTSDSNEFKSSAFKKAQWSSVKFSFRKFVKNSSENDEEENHFDDVATDRLTTSRNKKQLRIDKVSDRQSKVIVNFQTSLQLHRESVKDSLRRSKEMQEKINDSEYQDDEENKEVEENKRNRKTLNKNNAMNHLNKIINKALHSLSEVHLNKSTLKFQTLLTAWKRVWSRTERSSNEQSRIHCSTCTCSSSFILNE